MIVVDDVHKHFGGFHAVDGASLSIEKGSITVDGISLTVVDALDDGFTVAIIPHTQAVTTLSSKQQGAAVNIEVDITAKYVEKLISWKVSEEQADEVTS